MSTRVSSGAACLEVCKIAQTRGDRYLYSLGSATRFREHIVPAHRRCALTDRARHRMSALNGDKSRYNRRRRAAIVRRERSWATQAQAAMRVEAAALSNDPNQGDAGADLNGVSAMRPTRGGLIPE